MDSEITEKLISEWKERELPEVIDRKYDLKKYLNSKVNKIIALSGFRRVGKTYLLFGLIKDLLKENSREEVLYFNFEDERIPQSEDFLNNFAEKIIEKNGKFPKYLFLDEIQNMPNWSKWVRRIYDYEPKTRIFITGSSSKMSFNEIPTELRGRYLLKRVFPLSFKEFLEFKNKTEVAEKLVPLDSSLPKQRAKIKKFLSEFLELGGLPEIVLEDSPEKIEIIKSYYQSVVRKDIIESYNMKNKEVVKILLNLLLNSTEYSYNKTYNNIKSQGYSIGKENLISYIQSIEDSFFMFSIPIFSYKIKDRMQYPKKNYFIDNSFISKISTRFSGNKGRLFENTVAIELLREQKEFFYWKNIHNEEIDFVIKDGQKISQLIQVCKTISNYDTKKREIKSLFKASKELNCKNILIITQDTDKEEEVEWFGLKRNIKYIPLWKWLLQ